MAGVEGVGSVQGRVAWLSGIGGGGGRGSLERSWDLAVGYRRWGGAEEEEEEEVGRGGGSTRRKLEETKPSLLEE